MKWKKWKLGVLVAVGMSLLVTGSGLVEGMTWQQAVAIFCSALLTHFVTFLKDHPVEQIEFNGDTETKTKEELKP